MINGYFWFVLVAVVGIYWLDLVSDLLNVSAPASGIAGGILRSL